MRRRQSVALGIATAITAGSGAIAAAMLSTPASAGAPADAAMVTPAATAALTSNWYGSAPYVMPLDNNPPDLGQVMAASGQKAYELAFILAPNGGGCTPTWGGTAPVSSDTTVTGVVNAVRAAGGDVSASIGGFGGTKLGQTCGTPAATAAAYQQVISKYSLKAMDFDLEEPEYENTTAVNNELGAAQILQRNNPGLYVSITVPGTTSGTGFFGQNVLTTSKNLGFVPENFAIMPFDGGFNGSASQISALEAFHTLLMNTYGWSSATAYNHEGVSQMNGRSDTGEMFSEADFQNVLTYATSHGLTRYTFWAVNRDRQCSPPDNNGTTSGTCSSVAQASWDFTKFTTQFAGATPPTTPPTVPPTTPPPGACTAPAWTATAIFTGGMQASEAGHQYTAKWWTQGDDPATHHGTDDVWIDNGPCTGGGTTPPTTAPPTTAPPTTAPPTTAPPTTAPPTTAPPTTAPPTTPPGSATPWVANHSYTVGTLVTYGGHTYKCLQSHTSLVGWEPPNVPALWQLVS